MSASPLAPPIVLPRRTPGEGKLAEVEALVGPRGTRGRRRCRAGRNLRAVGGSGGQQCCSGGSSLNALGFYCNNRSFLFTVVACGDFFPFRITVDHLWALDHH